MLPNFARRFRDGVAILTLLFSFLLLSLPLQAQLKKGQKYVKAKEYELAEAAFRQDLDHPKYAAAAHLELANLLSREKEPNYDTTVEALRLVNRADSIFQQAPAKIKKKLRKRGCRAAVIATSEKNIIKKALLPLQERGRILAFDAFLERVGTVPRASKRHIEEARARIVRSELDRINFLDYASASSLVNKHGDLLLKSSLQFRNRLDGQLYRSFIAEYGYDELDRFKEDHPNHWVSVECWLEEFVAAIKSEGIEALVQFLEDYPLTTFDVLAQSELINRLDRNSSASLEANLQDRLEEARLNRKLRRSLSFGRTNIDEAELLSVIQRGAPSRRAYYLVEDALEYYFAEKDWEAALRLLEGSRAYFPDEQPEGCRTNFRYYSQKETWFRITTEIMARPAENIELRPIDELNTYRDELSPVVDITGEVLYYAAKRSGNSAADIYESKFDFTTDQWGEPQKVESLSSEWEEAPLSMTADGNQLLLFKAGKLFTSRRTKTGWSVPDSLASEVNSFPWIGRAVLSADGKVLIFAASYEALEAYRESNIDIYVALRQANGQFGKPFSIGNMINTEEQERSPFLHPDMKTLYFSSDGHPGLGGNDVFMSKRLDDSWTNWSEPYNLGKEINTLDNDWGYNLSVSPSGKVAYLSSDEMAWATQSDLFATGLPQAALPEAQKVIYGVVTSTTDLPPGTEVIIRDQTSGEEIVRTQTSPDGTFRYVLPDSTQKVRIDVVHRTFFPPKPLEMDLGEEEVIRLDDTLSAVSMQAMLREDVPAPLGVYFPVNESTLDTASFPGLQQVFNVVKGKPYRLEISGHTDKEGTADHNQALSEARANAVLAYLAELGLPTQQMKAIGYGFERPIAENDSEEGRAKNRRVEIRISVLATDEE